MANIIANAILNTANNPQKTARLAQLKSKPIDFSGGLKFVKKLRYADYKDYYYWIFLEVRQ